MPGKDSSRRKGKINSWKKLRDVYGIDPYPVVKQVFSSIIDEDISRSELLAGERRLCSLDFYEPTDRVVKGILEFRFQRNRGLHGFAGWFRARLSEKVTLSNAPGGAANPLETGLLPGELPRKG